MLPLIVLLPAIVAMVLGLTRRVSIAYVLTPLTTLVCLIGGVSLFLRFRAGETMTCVLPWLGLPDGLALCVDGVGLALAGVSVIAWVAASLAAVDYLRTDTQRLRFHVAFLITLTGVIGTFMAQGFLSLLLFFEVMTLASYILVVHNRDDESIGAGNLYLYLSLAGSLLLTSGIAVVYFLTGDVAFTTILPGGTASTLAVLLIGIGFAVKAGVVPLHLWLPLAHSVAPAPASAVLSGIMIKTGAYGIIRALLIADSALAADLGLFITMLAGITMVAGVSMALLQSNAKRMLAYHSISQMGYIMMGVGLAGVLGAGNVLGLTGALYHIINHALFKSALFLVVGAVYLRTHELDMYKLGGLWRDMPLIALLGLIAAMGISGVPGLNGYASKTVLHHALHYAAEKQSLMSFVEIAFMATGAGTACSFIKFFGYIFVGRPRSDYPARRPANLVTAAGVSLLALLIVILGVNPPLFFGMVAGPAVAGLTGGVVSTTIPVFTPEDFQGIAICLGLGAALFIVGSRTGLFHLHPPKWVSVHWLAVGASSLVGSSATLLVQAGQVLLNLSAAGTAWLGQRLGLILQEVDSQVPPPRYRRTLTVANISLDSAIIIAVLTVVLVSHYVVQLVG